VVHGTNTWSGQIRYPGNLSTTLSAGNNAGVDFGAGAVFAVITSGPGAAFAICGIAGGADGRTLVVHNATGYPMTISDDSGVDPTAANRIYTPSGEDMVLSGACTAGLVYDGNSSRWRVVFASHPIMTGSATWDPASLADGVGETSSAITVSGAAFGDYVQVAAPYDLQGITCSGHVSASGQVKIRLQNKTTGTIDLASGTWKVRVMR